MITRIKILSVTLVLIALALIADIALHEKGTSPGAVQLLGDVGAILGFVLAWTAYGAAEKAWKNRRTRKNP